MQFENKLKVAFQFAINYLKQKSPIDTGNLRYNAIKYRIEDNRFIIYVDEQIAPYMVYTNEKWINHKGQNPNESWWNRTIEDIIETMSIYLGGNLKRCN